jgi:hypothetical protein
MFFDIVNFLCVSPAPCGKNAREPTPESARPRLSRPPARLGEFDNFITLVREELD